MGNPLTESIIVSLTPHHKTGLDGVEVDPDMDNAVTCHAITIHYPDLVEGYPGEAQNVIPNKKRVCGILSGMFGRGEVA